MTPLNTAVLAGFVEATKVRRRNALLSYEKWSSRQVLVDRGANIETLDEEGLTPLHTAVSVDDIEMIKVRRRNSLLSYEEWPAL